MISAVAFVSWFPILLVMAFSIIIVSASVEQKHLGNKFTEQRILVIYFILYHGAFYKISTCYCWDL